MADQTLLFLARDIRGKTLKIIEDVTEQQAKFAPPGLHNSILWHAGHALVVVEHLSIKAANAKPSDYPAEWLEKFSWESKPATVKQWPTLAEVKAKLVVQSQNLTAAIEGLSEEQLSRSVGDPTKNRNVRWSILHGLHDEACHSGEIWLLKKLQTKA